MVKSKLLSCESAKSAIKGFCLFALGLLFACSYTTKEKLPADINQIKLDIQTIKESQEKSRLLIETEIFNKEKNSGAQTDGLRNSIISVKEELQKNQDEIKALKGKIEELTYAISQKEMLSSQGAAGEIRAKRPAPISVKTPRMNLPNEKTTDTLMQTQPANTQNPAEQNQPAQIIPNMPAGEDVELTLQSAKNAFSQAKYDDGIKTINDFITRYPDFTKLPDFLFILGECFFYKDDMENAKKIFEKIYFEHKLSGKTPDSLAFLAEISKKTNLKDKAIFYYEKIVAEYPTYNEMERIKEELKSLKEEK